MKYLEKETPTDRFASTRRVFLKRIGFITSAIGLFPYLPYRIKAVLADDPISLPLPAPANNSLELCMNSRKSYHGGWGGAVALDWLSPVVWAAGKAPFTGTYMNIFVTLDDGTEYVYDRNTHTITFNRSRVSTRNASFFLRFDRELDFDAGVAYMFALLAGVSLWNGVESQLASCPMGSNLYFGKRNLDRAITSVLVTSSSDNTLPPPSTAAEAPLFGDVISGLQYTGDLAGDNIPVEKLSQILWAGYGCTPHTTNSGKSGLTVPSSWTNYYLTERIYVANHLGVFRYQNRNPSSDFETTDHRIETVSSNDVRDILKTSVSRLPDAPLYLVECLNSSETGSFYARIETGFVAGNILLQGSAIGLGTHFTTKLTLQEQQNIQTSLGIPPTEVPWAVVSIGIAKKTCTADSDSDGDVDGIDTADFDPSVSDTADLAGELGRTDCPKK